MHSGVCTEKPGVIKKAFTYICIGTLVGSGTREGDKLMAPFVDHETAN